MGEHHNHHDHRSLDIQKVSNNLIIGICLNLVYVIAELAGGFFTGSLALIADAGHNFADVSSLFLALIAFKLIKIKSTRSNTYGYRKTSILISVFNSLLIVFTVGLIVREAIDRFNEPPHFNGLWITAIATVGVIINFATALLFLKDREKDLNIKSAYIHMMADGLVSVGVIVSGIVIKYTSAFWIDPAVSILIAIVVLYSSWSLIRESFRLATDAIPKGIDMEEVESRVRAIDKVVDFNHIHVWPLSTTENALTGHVVVSKDLSAEEVESVKSDVKNELIHMKISHSTLEIEYAPISVEASSC
jgi:cobalt-zinc-cadmium efflux system protein